MKPRIQPAEEVESRPPRHLWDTLIRVGLIVGLGAVCFQALSPFLRLIVWSIVLAITIYPLHQALARRIRGKQGLASVILVLIGITLIVVPSWLLMNSFADSIHSLIGAVQQNTLRIPEAREGIKTVPIVGNKLYGAWSKAHECRCQPAQPHDHRQRLAKPPYHKTAWKYRRRWRSHVSTTHGRLPYPKRRRRPRLRV